MLGGFRQRHRVHQPCWLKHETVIRFESLMGRRRNLGSVETILLEFDFTLADPEAISGPQIIERLLVPRGPQNGHPGGDLPFAESERQALGVLGDIAGPG